MPHLPRRERRTSMPAVLSTVTLVAVAACTPAHSVPASITQPGATTDDSSSTLAVAPPTLASSPPTPSAPSGPAFAVPPLLPFPTSTLTIQSGEPFTARTLPPGRALGHGHVVLPLLEGPDRAAVALAGGGGALVDTMSGRVLVAAPAAPATVAPRANAVVLKGIPLRILRTDRNDVVAPRFDARGRALKSASLVAMERRPIVLAIAEADSGEKLLGRLSADLTQVTLAPTELRKEDDNAYVYERSPLDAFELVANTRETAGKAGTPFSLPHEPGCVRLRVDDDGRPTCLDYRPMMPSGSGVRLLGGGWFVGSDPALRDDQDFVSHTSWGERRLAEDELHLANTRCSLQQSFADPPRVVFTCHQPAASVVMWSPEAVYSAPLAEGFPSGSGLPADGTILPILAGPFGENVATHWVDLVRNRLIETPRLKALAWNPDEGVLDRSLATDERGALWLLDVARGTRERIEDATGCSGILREDVPEGTDLGPARRLRTLACYAHPAKGHIESHILWSQILDLQRRTMYKTSLHVVSWHQDGTVILTTSTNIEAETPGAPGELSAVNVFKLI